MTGSYFTLPDGRRLAWYETGAGRPLILLHGWSMSAAVFAELAKTLSRSFRLLIPDLPGHGSSAPCAQASLAEMAEDLADWIAAEVGQAACLAGWSLGGMLAMELASRSRVPVERLVLLSSTPRFTNEGAWTSGLPATQVRTLARNLARRFEATLGDFFLLAFDPGEISRERLHEIREFAIKRAKRPDKATAAALLALLQDQDQRRLLPGICQPTLVIHGQRDRITPVTAGRFMAAALPHGRIAELADVGHCPFLSRPDDVAARMEEFFCEPREEY